MEKKLHEIEHYVETQKKQKALVALLDDVVEGQTLVDQAGQLEGDGRFTGTGAAGIENMHPSAARFEFKTGHGALVGARKVGREGDDKGIIVAAHGIGIFGRGRAGRRGLILGGTHGRNLPYRIEGAVIYIAAAADVEHQRNLKNGDIACGYCAGIAAAVNDDFISHRK